MDTLARSRRPSYRPVPADQLAHALTEMPGWRGDVHRIQRTVQPADLWALLERVADAEAELDHHTVVDLERGTLTFVLWTHARDAVTDADLELARRIDEVVDAASA
jgi:4a-hydroxytetrahydrobiopterin dehydratase